MKILALLALLLSPALTRAGDLDEYRNLGFSPDGKYFAFAAYGTHDGSGAPYARVAVVEVNANRFVASREVTLQAGDEARGTAEEAVERAARELKLKQYGIDRNPRLGTDLLVRLPTDRSDYKNGVFSTEAWAEGGASATAARYEVEIRESSAEDRSEGKYCTDLGFAPSLLELSLKGVANTPAEKFSLPLQKDASLPEARACGTRYELRRVTRFKDKLVVVLSYQSPGFEGPNVNVMVVSARAEL